MRHFAPDEQTPCASANQLSFLIYPCSLCVPLSNICRSTPWNIALGLLMYSHKPWVYGLCQNRDKFSSQTPPVVSLTDFLHNYEYDHQRTCSLTSVACVSTVCPILPSSSSYLLQVQCNVPYCWSPWQPRVLSSCHCASSSYRPTVRCCLPV